MAALARRFAVHLMTVFALVSSLLPGPVAAQSLLGEPRYASVLVDAGNGEVVYSQRADSSRYPASITKMMTLYLAFEALEQGRLTMDDTVLISPRAAAQPPSKLGLRAGETLTVRDAIFALAIKSANDIAVAMAERIGGTESRFASLMTLRAQELGMHNTRYVNASGLPDSRQLTSARDIAVLARALMRDFPQYYDTFGTRTWTFRGRQMNNHNHLLFQMAGVDGIKTGFTNSSGYNLAASAVRGRRRLIAVVLGGPSGAARDRQTRQLLETGFSLMARRDAGEPIQFAANLFETPALSAPIGSVVQGSDADDDDSDGDAVAAILRNPVRAASASTPRVSAPTRLAAIGMQPILQPGDREAPRPTPAPTPPASRAVAAEPTPVREAATAPRSRDRSGLRGEQDASPTRLARRDEDPSRGRNTRNARQSRDEERASSRRGREDDPRTTRLARNDDSRRGSRDDDQRDSRLSGQRAGRDDDARTTRLASRDEDRRGSRQASRERGGFTVQVGAFGSERDARARLSEVQRHLGGADSAVTRADRGQFRARFNGLTEADARAACRRVRGPCMVVGGA